MKGKTWDIICNSKHRWALK